MATMACDRQQLELLWQSFSIQISTGTVSSLTIPSEFLTRLGIEGVQELVARYSSLIDAPAQAAITRSSATIFRAYPSGQLALPDFASLNASQTPSTLSSASPSSNHTSATSSGRYRAKGKQEASRPRNAFIIYRSEHKDDLKAQHPDIHNNEISKILGTRWHAESEEVKDQYKARALKEKEEHLKANPGYRYQPRKPAEKKKRATKKKAPVSPKAASPPTSSMTTPQSDAPILTTSTEQRAEWMAMINQMSADDLALLLQASATPAATQHEFAQNEAGLFTFPISQTPPDTAIVDAMIDNHNASASPVEGMFSEMALRIGSSQPSTSELDVTHLATGPANHTASAQKSTSQSAAASNGSPQNTADDPLFDTFFDYNLLEADRMLELEASVSTFQDAFMDTGFMDTGHL